MSTLDFNSPMVNICGTKRWYASKAIPMVNSLLHIEAIEATSLYSSAGHIVAVYDLHIEVPFTIRLKPCIQLMNAIPVIRWSSYEAGIYHFERFRIAPIIGAIPFPVYQGELIQPTQAVLEIWSTGGAAEIAVAAQYLQLGLLKVANRSWTPETDVYTSTSCVHHRTGDGSDFSHYMTSCIF